MTPTNNPDRLLGLADKGFDPSQKAKTCFNCHSPDVVAHLTTIHGTVSPLGVCEYHAVFAIAAGIAIVMVSDGQLVGTLWTSGRHDTPPAGHPRALAMKEGSAGS